MKRRMLGRLSYANVMATIAVFISLGGGAYAATQLPRHSVGTRALKNGAVTPAKLSERARHVRRGRRGARGATGSTGPTGPAGATGAAGPNDLVSGAMSSPEQTLSSCAAPTPLTHTLTVPVASVLYATGVTSLSESDADYHAISSSLSLTDGGATELASTPRADAGTGIANTPVELDAAGLLLADSSQPAAGTPYVLQPGVTYTLTFAPEVSGGCAATAYLPSLALTWIALPQSG
jgi:hypothetical protein